MFISLSSRFAIKQIYNQPTEHHIDIDTNYIDLQETFLQNELLEHENKDDDEFYGIGSGVTTEMLEMEATTLHPTTTTVETTTIPISEFRFLCNFCCSL